MTEKKSFTEDSEQLVEHYQYPKEKQKLQGFVQDSWRRYEIENTERLISRAIHEHDSELQGATPYYKPGHIGPLVYEHMNMIGVEKAFVSGLQHTKSSMVKTIQQRVNDINTMLRGVGGFNRQLKSSFSRSAVVYLEQSDPAKLHREKVVFSINLADYELRHPMHAETEKEILQDGRTGKRYGWDYAVNVLSEIVSNTGLKPKYVKNDKRNCRFVMSQSLINQGESTPDEYFSFNLEYLDQEGVDRKISNYNEKLETLEKNIDQKEQRLNSGWRAKKEKARLGEEIDWYEKERSFFIGTNPDPNELDPGLLFTIEISTLKDYNITKDKMQVIMTKYLLALSRIARDKSLDQQLATDYNAGTPQKQQAERVNTNHAAGTADSRKTAGAKKPNSVNCPCH